MFGGGLGVLFIECPVGRLRVYFEKIRVLRAGLKCRNSRAWNNGIGRRFYFVGFRKWT
jgi:hypothetical protein